MRKLIVSEFITLDGVIQAPGGADEDRDGGFKHGGWTQPYWHDDIGKHFMTVLPQADALLLGRRTYVGHAQAFEPMAPGDPFGDIMNAPAKVRGVKDAREAALAQHHDHPRRRGRGRPPSEGAARQEHPHRRQQPAGAHPADRRSRRRAAPAAVSAGRRRRQARCSPPACTPSSPSRRRRLIQAASSACTTCAIGRSDRSGRSDPWAGARARRAALRGWPG